MRRVLQFVLALIAIFSISCNRNQTPDATGVFEATEILVSSEVSGKILDFNIDEGSRLKADSIIGIIDTTQLYLQKLRAIAGSNSVKSRKIDISLQIASIQRQIQNLEMEKQRVENLLREGSATQKQLDDINFQIEYLKKQLTAQTNTFESTNRSISSEFDSFKIQVDQLNDQLKKSYIKSPIDGIMLSKYADAGELAFQGKPLFKVANLDDLILRAYIVYNQLTQIKIGDQVKIYVSEPENNMNEYTGVITWISDKAEFTPKSIQTKDERQNLVYAVKIKVQNNGLIKIGMYGDVKFN